MQTRGIDLPGRANRGALSAVNVGYGHGYSVRGIDS